MTIKSTKSKTVKKTVVKKTTVPKPPKVEPKTEWVSFSAEEYKNAAQDLCHLSAKAVNSNATAGGVRLGGPSVDMPYLSVSTCGPEHFQLDSISNVDQATRFAKQMNAVVNRTADARFGVPSEETEAMIAVEVDKIMASTTLSATKKTKLAKKIRMDMIKKSTLDPIPEDEKLAVLDVMSNLTPHSTCGEPDCRLKQVIMPGMDDSDYVLTPLHSGSFASMIQQGEKNMLEEINAAIPKKENHRKRLFNRARMNFGGANPQNAGILVVDMTQPLFFKPPCESMAVKKILSLHYMGIPVLLDQEIDPYLALLDQQRSKKDTMRCRDQRESALRRLVRKSLDRGAETYRLLSENRDMLPSGQDEDNFELLGHEVMNNVLVRGLIIAGGRDAKWRKLYSQCLSEKIMNRKRKVRDRDGTWVTVDSGLSDSDAQNLRSTIENEVLQ